LWSNAAKIAGLRFKVFSDGKEVPMEGENPTIKSSEKGKLRVFWPLKIRGAAIVMEIGERQMEIKSTGGTALNWFLDLTTADGANLPFQKIGKSRIDCRFEGLNYSVSAISGHFSRPNEELAFRVSPEKNIILLRFADNGYK
jgi:hypothetical protein